MNHQITLNGRTSKRGFTLIELLIVIGILAILATTVVLVLNPAQILAETRDAQRINDLDTVRTSINLYLTSAVSPDLDDAYLTGAGIGCLGDWWSSSSAVAAGFQPFANPAPTEVSQTLATPRDLTGLGWVPIDFASLTTGAPLPNLPIDPNPDVTATLATTGRFYAYQCNNTSKVYELNANMESTKYGTAATGPEDDDGGTSATIYEVGSAAGLAL